MKCLPLVDHKYLNINILDEGSDDDAEGEKPLTMEEFMQKAREKIENKQTQQSKQKRNLAPKMKKK
jgi:hypothetical protein